MINKREDYIDLLRFVGIFLMIMGHIGFGYLFDKWIHCFHMPIFFVISGYFHKNLKIRILLKKRTRSLLLPYLVFGIIHCFIYFIQIKEIDNRAFYLLFWENTKDGGIPIAGALWFLTAVFVSDIVFTLIRKIQVSDVIQVIFSMSVALLGMAFSTYLPFRLPFAIDAGLVGTGLFQFGLLLKNKIQKALQIKGLLSFVCLAFFSFLGLFLNGPINMRTGNYSVWPLFWINALGMTTCLWSLARVLFLFLNQFYWSNKTLRFIATMGRDSIVFLCLNQLIIMITKKMLSFILHGDSTVILIAQKVVALVITMGLLCLVRLIIVKTKLRYLIGR